MGALCLTTGCGLLLAPRVDEQEGRQRDGGAGIASPGDAVAPADAAAADAEDASGSAGTSDGAAGRSEPAPGVDCLIEGGFGPGEPVAVLNSEADDHGPTVTADGLELIFASSRDGWDGSYGGGPHDLWRSTRADVDEPWGEPELLEELESWPASTKPMFRADGLGLYFIRSSRWHGDIYFTTRSDRDAPWQPPERVDELSSTQRDSGAAPTETDRTIFIASRREWASTDLYMATRASPDDPWNAPALIEELEIDEVDLDPFPLADGDVLLFRRLRDPDSDSDLWFTRRAGPDAPYEMPAPIPGAINTADDEGDPFLTPRGELYFSRGEDGQHDLFVATCER